MKSISSEGQDALDSGRFAVRALVKVTLPDASTVCLWDDVGTIEVGGDTYTGAAGRFTLAPGQSVKDQTVRPLDITLSGLDTEVAAMVDAADWHQAPIVVQRAIIALDVPAVLHLVTEFVGRLDQMIWRETSTSTITFRAESASRERTRGGARTRADPDQRQRDSADGFFEFAAAAVNTPINWGRDPQKMGRTAKPGGIAGLIDKIF